MITDIFYQLSHRFITFSILVRISISECKFLFSKLCVRQNKRIYLDQLTTFSKVIPYDWNTDLITDIFYQLSHRFITFSILVRISISECKFLFSKLCVRQNKRIYLDQLTTFSKVIPYDWNTDLITDIFYQLSHRFITFSILVRISISECKFLFSKLCVRQNKRIYLDQLTTFSKVIPYDWNTDLITDIFYHRSHRFITFSLLA